MTNEEIWELQLQPLEVDDAALEAALNASGPTPFLMGADGRPDGDAATLQPSRDCPGCRPRPASSPP